MAHPDRATLFDKLEELRVPVDVIGGTSMGAIVAGLFFGALPALQAARVNCLGGLKIGSADAGCRRSKLRASLLIAQVALSVVLLITAGLMLQSLTTREPDLDQLELRPRQRLGLREQLPGALGIAAELRAHAERDERVGEERRVVRHDLGEASTLEEVVRAHLGPAAGAHDVVDGADLRDLEHSLRSLVSEDQALGAASARVRSVAGTRTKR